MPQVSIIILNFNSPHNIQRLLPSLKKTTGVTYETVVVDNGSEPDTVEIVKQLRDDGLIDTLVLEPVNHYFSEGNNIGVRHSDPSSEFILLLNSDIEILDGTWLQRMVEWANGIPETFYPFAWTPHPTHPSNIRRGIVSLGWVWFKDRILPDGFCTLIRREAWRDIDPDFPMAYGIMKMLSSAIRDGHPCGCLSQYGKHVKHYGQGSHVAGSRIKPRAKPDMDGSWKDVECEGLDWTLGPHEMESQMSWSHHIKDRFDNAKQTPSDINEHMDTLLNLARECNSVVEAGVRYVVSTWAWLWGCACRGGTVTSYCWTLIPEIQEAIDLCEKEGVTWHFHDGDWLTQEIPDCDLLFIDTNHTYSQLTDELRMHGSKAQRYIVLHDTEHFGTTGADGKSPGLWQAVTEFISNGTWKIKTHYTHNNGLTILERR